MKKKSTKRIKKAEQGGRQDRLIREARENPWGLFTADELHFVIRRSINFVLSAKNQGAPFPGGVTRPEWFMEWLKNNPNFVVKASKGSASTASDGET